MAWVFGDAEHAFVVVGAFFNAFDPDSLTAVDDIVFAPLKECYLRQTQTSEDVATAILRIHAVARYAYEIVRSTDEELWQVEPFAFVVHH